MIVKKVIMNIKQEDFDTLVKKYVSVLTKYSDLLDILKQKLENNSELKIALTINNKSEDKKND